MSREISTTHSQIIRDRKQLLEVFLQGGRPRDEFRVGVETEQFGLLRDSGRALPFEGTPGVRKVLEAYAKDGNWKEVLDQGVLIALEQDGSAITLEPGGQVELSTRQHGSLATLADEMRRHGEVLSKLGEEMDVVWFNAGIHPVTGISDALWVPKSRYRIMRKYYRSRKGKAHIMMALTASGQFNLDYLDEADAKVKLHVGAALGPVVGAMMANSAVEVGRRNGYCSRRLQVWRETDPDRCGVPSFFVDGSFSFKKYRDYALNVPMYFVVRDGNYIDHTNVTFDEFLSDPGEVGPALMSDWELHLTTLFPDVRLKNHLEFRTADAQPTPLTLALTAFWIGLIYDSDTLKKVHERVAHLSQKEIIEATEDVARRGMAASLGEESILAVCRDMVKLAADGLQRVGEAWEDPGGHFLDPLKEVVDVGRSPAEQLIERWDGTLPSLYSLACA